MLKILGRASSINVRKVQWTAAELGLPFDHEPWGLGDLSLASAEFKALNPNAKVPVLVDGDFVLWESNAICRYLANTQPQAGLLPEDLRARAVVDQWLDWQATELNYAWRHAFLGIVRKHPSFLDPDRIEASKKNWNALMGLLDQALGNTGAYIAGDRFTLADIAIGMSVHRWTSTPFEKPALTHVARYYATIQSRPAFQQYGDTGEA